jgi:serine/threonine-protein kinase
MRLIRGRTLSGAARDYHRHREEGRDEPLALVTLLNAFVAVCNTIAYAHSNGVIHRDLKGDNVILGDFGEVVVLDWGLAKPVDDSTKEGEGEGEGVADPAGGLDALSETDSVRTVAGRVIGTPAFMAPEQAAGRLEQIDRRTDIFGLGAILYEILTGRPPFVGTTTIEVLWKAMRVEAEPPRALWAKVPPPLEAACLRALARERNDRYSTAVELARDVQIWQETQRRRVEDALRSQTRILQSILGNMGEALLVADQAGTLLLINPAAERMLGVRLNDGNMAAACARFHPFLADQVTPCPADDFPLARAIRGEVIDDAELYLRVDGQPDGRWVIASARPLRDESGAVEGGVVVLHDITARKRAEDDLRRSRERFELAVLGSQDGLWDWDLETDEVYFSPRWKSMIGFEDHEFPHRIEAWAARLHPDEREQVMAANNAHIAGTTPHYEYEYRLRHKDGSYRWILARGVALRDAQGRAYRMAGSHVDVTARKQAEDALRHAGNGTPPRS